MWSHHHIRFSEPFDGVLHVVVPTDEYSHCTVREAAHQFFYKGVMIDDQPGARVDPVDNHYDWSVMSLGSNGS